MFFFGMLICAPCGREFRVVLSGKSKWRLSNGGLRPHSAICARSSTVHFLWPFGPLSKGNFRRKMATIVGNPGQLWTSTLTAHLINPHLDFPDFVLRDLAKNNKLNTKMAKLD